MITGSTLFQSVNTFSKRFLYPSKNEPRFVKRDGQLVRGSVVEITDSARRVAEPINVQYGSQTGWFGVHELQVPDYSSLRKGMEVQVKYGNKAFSCTVKGVSMERQRAKRAVEVHYNGYDSDDDEWVGADRLMSHALKFVQPRLLGQANPANAKPSSAGDDAKPTFSSGSRGPVLKLGMAVVVKRKNALLRGVVVEVSNEAEKAALVQTWLGSSESEMAWFGVQDLQIPDYSAFAVGLQVGVTSGTKVYLATVLQVNFDEDKRSTPIHIRYNGRQAEDDEWVGADRLRSKALKLIQPTMPSASSVSSKESKSSSSDPASKVASPGRPALQCGMVVFNVSSSLCCEVLEISSAPERAAAPVKVRQYTTKNHSAWLAVDQLRLPDYSGLVKKLRVTVHSDGKPYLCTVLEVSNSKERAQAPVRVHYEGYSSEDDEWVGADRLRSKELTLLRCLCRTTQHHRSRNLVPLRNRQRSRPWMPPRCTALVMLGLHRQCLPCHGTSARARMMRRPREALTWQQQLWKQRLQQMARPKRRSSTWRQP